MTEALPQQFVTDDAETAPSPTDVPGTPAQTETPETAESGGRRGRPRSQEAMDRDQRVFDALGNGQQKTRNEIAEEVGFDGGLTYLSLYRLKHSGHVVRVSDGTTRRAWRQTTPDDVQTTEPSVAQEPSLEQPTEG